MSDGKSGKANSVPHLPTCWASEQLYSPNGRGCPRSPFCLSRRSSSHGLGEIDVVRVGSSTVLHRHVDTVGRLFFGSPRLSGTRTPSMLWLRRSADGCASGVCVVGLPPSSPAQNDQLLTTWPQRNRRRVRRAAHRRGIRGSGLGLPPENETGAGACSAQESGALRGWARITMALLALTALCPFTRCCMQHSWAPAPKYLRTIQSIYIGCIPT